MKASQKNLHRHVDFLTSLRPFRNYRQLDSLNRVAAYIREAFEESGLTVREQTWTVDGQIYTNVIGVYNEAGSERLVVGAHYDVCGDQPGADDNASAVAGLLESARLVCKEKPKLAYRIEFVAYCLEEPPFFGTKQMGSYIHAASLHEEQASVLGMICYEMIGYFSDEPGSQTYPTAELEQRYPSTANFIIVVGIAPHREFTERVHRLMSAKAAIDVQLVHFPESHASAGLAGLSDQRNYWTFGYPALMINDTSFIRNPHYHEPTDTIDTLDFAKMAAVVSATCQAIVKFK
jgi:Zn-dependent M28 family amino/carboxypeptidase